MVASFLLLAGRETDGKSHQIGLAFDCSLASRAVTPSSDSMGCYFLWEVSWCQLKCLTAIWQKVLKWCKILLPVHVCSKDVWRSSFVPKGFLLFSSLISYFLLFSFFFSWSGVICPYPDGINITLLGNSREKQSWVHSRPALGSLVGGYPQS